jgi:hypothetical protein
MMMTIVSCVCACVCVKNVYFCIHISVLDDSCVSCVCVCVCACMKNVCVCLRVWKMCICVKPIYPLNYATETNLRFETALAFVCVCLWKMRICTYIYLWNLCSCWRLRLLRVYERFTGIYLRNFRSCWWQELLCVWMRETMCVCVFLQTYTCEISVLVDDKSCCACVWERQMCVCAYIHVCIQTMCTCKYKHTRDEAVESLLRICIYNLYIHVCMCTFWCIYACFPPQYVCIYVRVSTCASLCMADKSICIYVCLYIYIYMHIIPFPNL